MNYFTRMRTIKDFGSRQFRQGLRTLPLSVTHSGGPATFAIVINCWGPNSGEDISVSTLMHNTFDMWPFCFRGNPTYVIFKLLLATFISFSTYMYMFRAIWKFTQFPNCAAQIRNCEIANQFQNCKPISKLHGQVYAIWKLRNQLYAISKLRCAN